MDIVTLAMAKAYSDSKGGYSEKKTTTILEETQLYNPGDNLSFTGGDFATDLEQFESGKTYTVNLDSGSYECVPKYIEGMGNVLGNAAMFGGENTGESFFIAINEGLMGVADFGCGTKASVDMVEETIVPIDPKYLGDKVIDLAKYIPSTYNSFNDIVLALFAEGGGRLIFHNDTTFWSDVDKYNHLKFAIDANELVPGLMVECASNSRTISKGVTTSIEFSFLVFLNGCMRATVVFQRDTNLDNSIIVVVEPLTIPGV